MPEILNRLNQRLTVRLNGSASVILEPNGKAKINEKDVSSYGVKMALEEQKIIILANQGSSGTRSAKTKEE